LISTRRRFLSLDTLPVCALTKGFVVFFFFPVLFPRTALLFRWVSSLFLSVGLGVLGRDGGIGSKMVKFFSHCGDFIAGISFFRCSHSRPAGVLSLSFGPFRLYFGSFHHHSVSECAKLKILVSPSRSPDPFSPFLTPTSLGLVRFPRSARFLPSELSLASPTSPVAGSSKNQVPHSLFYSCY